VTDAEVLDSIPQAGAERAAGLFAFQTRQPSGPIMAAARALLEFELWRSEQSHEMQMDITISIARAVKALKEAKERFRREVSK
jgi:hypothetical protein